MVGFWFFISLLVICITIIAGIFVYKAEENFSLWETKKYLKQIIKELGEIKEALAKMGG